MIGSADIFKKSQRVRPPVHQAATSIIPRLGRNGQSAIALLSISSYETALPKAKNRLKGHRIGRGGETMLTNEAGQGIPEYSLILAAVTTLTLLTFVLLGDT